MCRFGRDNFEEALKITKRVDLNDTNWDHFKYMVYDIPNHSGPYRERYAALGNVASSKQMTVILNHHYVEEKLGSSQSSITQVAPKVVCLDVPHLESYYQDIIDQGGEGVILRDPESLLKPGRSSGYLKHKVSTCCANKMLKPQLTLSPEIQRRRGHDCISTGRWAMGMQVVCSTPLCLHPPLFKSLVSNPCDKQNINTRPNGVTFVATTGTSEFVKRWNPKPGDIVSFRHSGFLHTSKKPKSAALYRLRPDLSWDDVGNSFKEQKPREKSGRYTIPISTMC